MNEKNMASSSSSGTRWG